MPYPFSLIPAGGSWIILTQGMRGLQGEEGPPATLGQNLQDLDSLSVVADTFLGWDGSKVMQSFSAPAFGRSVVASATALAARLTLGLVIGTDVQGYNANLAGIAGLTSAANKGIMFTGGGGAAATYDLSAYAMTLLDDTTAGAARTTLGGTTVGQSFFTTANPSAITFPRVNANNTVSYLSASFFASAIGLGTKDSVSFESLTVNAGISLTNGGLQIWDTMTFASNFGPSYITCGNSLELNAGGGVHINTFLNVDGSIGAGSFSGDGSSIYHLRADAIGSGTGKLPPDVLPSLAITEYLGTAADETAMLSFGVGETGDWCIRSDLGTTWVQTADDGTQLGNWQEMSYPAAPVTSVNGQTGTVTITVASIGAASATHTHALSAVTSGYTSGQLIWASGSSTLASLAASALATSGTHLRITSQAKTDVAFAARANASQTANIIEVQNSAGTAQTYVNSTYGIVVAGASTFNSTIGGSGLVTLTGGLISRVGVGPNNTVIGSSASAGNSGVTVGDNAASGLASVAIGVNASSNADTAVALGYAATANFIGAISIGYTTAAAGVNTISIGRATQSNYGVVIGYRITDLAIGDTALGGRMDASTGSCRTLFYAVNTFSNERVSGCLIANFDVTTDSVREGSLQFQVWYSSAPTAYNSLKMRATSTGPQTTIGIGTGSATARVGGKLTDFSSDAGNSTTTETDIYSYTVPANSVLLTGDNLEAFYSFAVTGSATATSQFKVYFAGTARFDSGALSLASTGNWQCWVSVVRTGSATGRISVALQTPGASLSVYTAEVDMTSLDWTTTNVLKVTAQRAGVGAATNDIVGKHGWVRVDPAAV